MDSTQDCNDCLNHVQGTIPQECRACLTVTERTDTKYPFFAIREVKDAPAPAPAADTKLTNPKDAIGSTKLPMNLVPDTLAVFASLAFAEGAAKYGSSNWRVAGVRSSIYRAAMGRHLAKWWNGENEDPATGVPHLASVIACAGIILDAELAGKLTDDRPPAVPISDLIDGFEAKVKKLYALHADKHPHHHTIEDTNGETV